MNLLTKDVEVVKKQYIKICCLTLLGCFLYMVCTEPTWAVTVNELIQPVQGLKDEIFGGWMMVVKIGAAVAAIMFSIFKGSLVPLGIGAGLTAGIHLYDAYLVNAAAGALI